MLANLRTEMYKRKITSKDMGKCINRSEKSISNKIHERSDVTDMRYLFESDENDTKSA